VTFIYCLWNPTCIKKTTANRFGWWPFCWANSLKKTRKGGHKSVRKSRRGGCFHVWKKKIRKATDLFLLRRSLCDLEGNQSD